MLNKNELEVKLATLSDDELLATLNMGTQHALSRHGEDVGFCNMINKGYYAVEQSRNDNDEKYVSACGSNAEMANWIRRILLEKLDTYIDKVNSGEKFTLSLHDREAEPMYGVEQTYNHACVLKETKTMTLQFIPLPEGDRKYMDFGAELLTAYPNIKDDRATVSDKDLWAEIQKEEYFASASLSEKTFLYSSTLNLPDAYSCRYDRESDIASVSMTYWAWDRNTDEEREITHALISAEDDIYIEGKASGYGKAIFIDFGTEAFERYKRGQPEIAKVFENIKNKNEELYRDSRIMIAEKELDYADR